MMPGPQIQQRQSPVAPGMRDGWYGEEIQYLESLTAESEPVRSAYYGVRELLQDPILVKYSAEKEGIFFHEPVQHQAYGITDEDLREAVRQDPLFAELYGICRITPDISRKLRIVQICR